MDQPSYIASPLNRAVRYLTTTDKLKEQADLYPDKEIFIFYSLIGGRKSITFAELYKESTEFSRVLVSLGIQKGDHVIMHLHTSIEWLIVGFGLLAIGAIPVSYVVYDVAPDMEYVLDTTEAVAIFFTSLSPDKREGVSQRIKQTSSKLKFAVSLDVNDDCDEFLSYNKLRKMDVHKDMKCDISLDPDDVAIILRSSGTTGRPKLIPHSHLSFQKIFGSMSAKYDKMYTNINFSWMYGSPIGNIFRGQPRVHITEERTPISIKGHLDIIDKEGCTTIFVTPDIMYSILKENLSFPPCVNVLVLGGRPVEKRKYRAFFDQISCIASSYGNMELGPIASIVCKNVVELEDNIGGYARPGIEVKVVDDTDQTVKRGTKGKIFARRDYPFLGYYGGEKVTQDPSGWFDTRDVGYISTDNKLYVIGRDREWIIRDGQTIHAADIENIIMGLNIPKVEDVIIVPIPDEIHDEESCACVILKEGRIISQDTLLQVFAAKIRDDRLRPKYVVFVDSYPTNLNGKLMRKAITEHAIKSLMENK